MSVGVPRGAAGTGKRRASAPPAGSARPWDFEYAPVPTAATAPEDGPLDVVIATRSPVPPQAVAEAVATVAPDIQIEELLGQAPIFWLRARAPGRASHAKLLLALRSAAVPVRYVAPSDRSTHAVAPRPEGPTSPAARPEGWRTRRRSLGADPDTPGRWFLRAGGGGIGVDRRRCGGGAGARLAVIDDDALAADQLDLEREVLVMMDHPPRNHAHGALMVAWAVGGRRPDAFRGVAPDASPRLYLIPKPGASLLALPLAIVRAVSDGADVVVCATYVEGSTTPMLDDAIEFAWRFGRRGRGSAIVLPTGREASSALGSLHASFSLGFGEPASDPRVFCVGPSARGDGWFLWRDRKGRSRPFANRGPSVRWLAPGDDMAYPFQSDGNTGPSSERLFHSESSGASAVAAGALLLVLSCNPMLRAAELDALVTRTLDAISPVPPASGAPFADSSDLLPLESDRDQHNAKHGYGRINAGRACVAAGDPLALALVLIGADGAARAWHDARRKGAAAADLYSRHLGRWAVRALLTDTILCHGVCALVRHGRLIAHQPTRRAAHGKGGVFRHLAILLRSLAESRGAPPPPARVRSELVSLIDRAEIAAGAAREIDEIESAFAELAGQVFRITDAALPQSSSSAK